MIFDKQGTYLGFLFIPAINEARKAWLSIQKIFKKLKKKSATTYLKLFDSVIKSNILYACKC